ncbi:MAG: DUF2508 family protein [Agathobacter sp.]|nr:DUF2508 family protein [Agathobacter sp.]
MKLFNLHPTEENTAYRTLKSDIEKTASDLNAAYTNLQQVTEPELIDYYIYHTKAVQTRYHYLLSCAKKLEDSTFH